MSKNTFANRVDPGSATRIPNDERSEDHMTRTINPRALWGLALAFLFAAAASMAQTFEVVHSFASSEGNDPQSGLVQLSNGDFAGTTVGGYGTLFKMDTGGRLATIYAFNGPRDGANPHAPLLPAPDGSLYGTTLNGFAGWGGIFRWEAGALRVLKIFEPSNGGPGNEGAAPHAPIIMAPEGMASQSEFYGVTTEGGRNGLGTIFEMDSLTDAVETIHHFSGFDGANPCESLVELDGRLYGTTPTGGSTNNGAIFRIDREGGNFTVIHHFTGRDGARPEAGLIAIDGFLYGTTFAGGNHGMGTVYRLTAAGANFSVIHHFTALEGSNPHAALVLARDGHLYGTTFAGGGGTSPSFFGTIFRLNAGTATGGFSVIHRFHLQDGAFAQARLIEASDGALYGTTAQGGSEGRGVIFRIVFVPIESITPTSGPASGGMAVALAGSNFQPGAALRFGSVEATGVVVASDDSLRATTPALLPGTLNDILVDNPDNTRGGVLKGYFADFLDVPQADIFHDFVEKIFRGRVTAGIGGGLFGRNEPATRAQMAVFLLKAKYGPFYAPKPATGKIFADVPASDRFAAWIEQAFNEGIVRDCGLYGFSSYCPYSPMTREEMAVGLLKAKYGSLYEPPACTGIFKDVPCTSEFAPWIEQLFHEGITGGCDGGDFFCPGKPVTRGQTAVFLTKTFDLR